MEQVIIYAPMMESEDPSLNWDKVTVRYVMDNRNLILRKIKFRALNKYSLSLDNMDAEEIYDEVLESAIKGEDYDLEKARVSDEVTISLDGYVWSKIKNCVLRFVSDKAEYDKKVVRGMVRGNKQNEEEVEILDIIPDKHVAENFVACECSIKSLDELRYKRYKYGVDIYMMLYISYRTMNKPEDAKNKLLSILGINKKELSEAKERMLSDYEVMDAIKALNKEDSEVEAANEIARFVYGIKDIDRAIEVI